MKFSWNSSDVALRALALFLAVVLWVYVHFVDHGRFSLITKLIN